ncbi:MAG: hypothetical protein N2Z57_02950, partial [Oscillospiraceae bacterium]|nr:hypothetical protein [Oscillospiraceae bacterium]
REQSFLRELAIADKENNHSKAEELTLKLDEVQKKLNYIAEKYLVLHLDKHFKTLEFYKSICSEEF